MVHEIINEKYKKIGEITQLFGSKNLASVKKRVNKLEKKLALPNEEIIAQTRFLRDNPNNEKIVEMVKNGQARWLLNAVDLISRVEEHYNAGMEMYNALHLYHSENYTKYCGEIEKPGTKEKLIECEENIKNIRDKHISLVNEYSNFKIGQLDNSYNFNNVHNRLNDWMENLVEMAKKLPKSATFEIPYKTVQIYKKYKIDEMLKRDSIRHCESFDEGMINSIAKNRQKEVKTVLDVVLKISKINSKFVKMLENKPEPFKEMTAKLKNMQKTNLISKQEYLNKIRKLQLIKNIWNKG